VRAGLPAGAVAEVGRTRAEALGRALVRWADSTSTDGWAAAEPGGTGAACERLRSLAGVLPEIRHESHPSGLWRARAGAGRPFAGLDADHAAERALLHALAVRQLDAEPGDLVPAAGRREPDEAALERICRALSLTPRPVPTAPLVSAHLVGVAL
jgi:hypothetical protein